MLPLPLRRRHGKLNQAASLRASAKAAGHGGYAAAHGGGMHGNPSGVYQSEAEKLALERRLLTENRRVLELEEEHAKSGKAVGLDVYGGGAMLPADQGIWDNFTVKKHFIMLSTVIASQLLLVDEVMRAGRNMKRQGPGGAY